MGALVDLLITDQRQYRDAQPCNDKIIYPCPDENGDRTMLGDKQKAWFKSALAELQTTWKIWGSEVMLMGFGTAPGPNHGSHQRHLGRLPEGAQGDSRLHPRRQHPERRRADRRHPHLLRRNGRHHRRHRHRPAGGAGVRRRFRDLTWSSGGVRRPGASSTTWRRSTPISSSRISSIAASASSTSARRSSTAS